MESLCWGLHPGSHDRVLRRLAELAYDSLQASVLVHDAFSENPQHFVHCLVLSMECIVSDG
jgi:hypothetical protein